MAAGRVYKRGNTWTWRIDDPRASASGQRRQVSKGGFGTKKAAEAALHTAIAAMGADTWADPSAMTVGEYLDSWLSAAAPDLSTSTRHSYQVAIDRLKPEIGSVRLQALRAPMARSALNALRDRGLSPKTVRNTYVVLHRAISQALVDGLLARDPLAGVKAPKVEKRTHAVWSPAQIRTFLDCLDDPVMKVIVTVAATTGMRRAEILGLRWGDVNLKGCSLSVHQSLTAVNGECVVVPPKTAASIRSIPIDGDTASVLRAHRAAQASSRLAAGELWDDSHDLVFRDALGAPLHPDRVSKAFSRAVERSGLPKIRLHDLRHSWATNALAVGTAAKVVSEQLGHSGISITLDTYTSVPEKTARTAVDAVAAEIFGK